MEIPHFLIAQVREAKGVLVLGAGASASATAGTGERRPCGRHWLDSSPDQFLGGSIGSATTNGQRIRDQRGRASSRSRIHQGRVRALGARAISLSLPSFKWHGIATTNFDRVIEKAYEQCQKPLRRLKTGHPEW